MKNVKIDCSEIKDTEILDAFELLQIACSMYDENSKEHLEASETFDKFVSDISEENKNRSDADNNALKALKDFSAGKISIMPSYIFITDRFLKGKNKILAQIDAIVRENKFCDYQSDIFLDFVEILEPDFEWDETFHKIKLMKENESISLPKKEALDKLIEKMHEFRNFKEQMTDF